MTTNFGTTKEMRTLIKQAEAQGWEVSMRAAGHLKWVSPNGDTVFTSRTPSDRRAVKKITKDLRLRGFIEIKRR